MTVLCSISTRGRYDTTLPLAIQSVLMQTRLPDKLMIFDDNDPPKDMRDVQIYQYLFMMMDLKGLKWEWAFAEKKGQHYNHDKANKMGFDWVWRMDDDTVAEPNVLETFMRHVEQYKGPDLGGVGGAVLTPPFQQGLVATGKIEDIYTEPNLQWDYIKEVREVDHLHCSFLYKAGECDYDLGLSRIAHREESMFTYSLRRKGFKLILVPDAVTWHMKNKAGGIRDGAREMFEHDELRFRQMLDMKDYTVVVLDNGLGDHIVFKHVLPFVTNPVVYSCYPDVVPGRSIADAKMTFGNLDRFNIYMKMDEWNWKGSLEDAFKKLYVKPVKPQPPAGRIVR